VVRLADVAELDHRGHERRLAEASAKSTLVARVASRDTAWAVSQENVERVKASIEAYNEGQYQAALAYFDPNIEWRVPSEMDLDIGVLRGHDGVLTFWEMVAETFGNFRLADLEFRDAGERVVVRTRLVGQGKRSGVPTEMELHQVAELENGLIKRLEYFTSHDRALEAAGLKD